MSNEPKELQVELCTKVRQQTCIHCNKRTKRVHGYRMQKIQGPILTNKPVVIYLRKRRYKCIQCNHTFFERLQMVDHYQRCTSGLQTTSLTYAAIGSFTTAAQLA